MSPGATGGLSACLAVFAFIGVLFSAPMKAEARQACRLFRGDGSPLSFESAIAVLAEADIVLFGEVHGNALIHWMERECARGLHDAKKGMLDLGAEMLESDQQPLVDDYLRGLVSEGAFLRDARLWPNHRRDYQALLSFAREKHLAFTATSPPGRYAAVVFKSGLKALEKSCPEDHPCRAHIAILPVVPPSADILGDDKGFSLEWRRIHLRGNFKEAQALKDATMARHILSARRPGRTFLHFNGRGHSDFRRGITEYLLTAAPNLKIVTVSPAVQDDIFILEEQSKGRADIIITIPSNFPGGD